jgi:hypothetical protein
MSEQAKYRKAETAQLFEGGDEPSGYMAACMICGVEFEASSLLVRAWNRANKRLKRQGDRPLERNEIATCGAACSAKHGARLDATEAARREELARIVARILAGETVHVPNEIMRCPSDFDRIQWARGKVLAKAADAAAAAAAHAAKAKAKANG